MFFLGVGGALGAVSRYLLDLFVKKTLKDPIIPISIMIINYIGSFLLGFFLNFFSRADEILVSSIYLLLVTGYLGAFTTFSTFCMETIQLLQKRFIKKACYYVGLTMVGCMALFCIGYFLSSMI